MVPPVRVIGGGLAGSEAAWQIAHAGLPVLLQEMRPQRSTPAHKTGRLAELVCSNSFRSDDGDNNAVGLLHEELRRAGSIVMAAADRHRVPAGSALAVDREGFAAAVEAAIADEPLIAVERREAHRLPAAGDGPAIVATGPLTSDALAADIRRATGAEALAFFDAIAPIVYRDSIDFDIAWMQSRYDKSGDKTGGAPGAGDEAAYVNCPLSSAAYDAFVDGLLAAEKATPREWEQGTPYFEGCLPIEVMAERGRNTLRFGPMKPVGLTDPNSGRRPFAVVQLRQDNAQATLFNMVGFQTRLKHGEQTRLIRTVPGLANARFARLGGIHRNTFIDSPALLDGALRLRRRPHLRFAGQIAGVEGYVESAAIGLLAGRFAVLERQGRAIHPPPATTALGALLNHITVGHVAGGAGSFQPMNCNFGLFPPPDPRLRGKQRRASFASRARADLGHWLQRWRGWQGRQDQPAASRRSTSATASTASPASTAP